MTKRFSNIALVMIASAYVISCGNDRQVIALADSTQAASSEGEALYQKAKALDDAGDTKKAAKLYGEAADDFPMAKTSAQARYRQAEILNQQGKTIDAFDAYQKFLERYQSSSLYTKALASQEKIAQETANGKVKSKVFGIKSMVSTKKIVEMLGQVRDNAPRSEISANAQFKIAEIYNGEKKYKESVDAYRQLVRDQPETKQAAEAQFRIGLVFLEQANTGNQNQATLGLASEALNDYLMQYPSHSRNSEARKLLVEIKSKDLDRSLSIAKFYERTGEIESAKLYYRDILKRSSSGGAHDYAKARLKELGE